MNKMKQQKKPYKNIKYIFILIINTNRESVKLVANGQTIFTAKSVVYIDKCDNDRILSHYPTIHESLYTFFLADNQLFHYSSPLRK